jgi:excisionase family DNA binding protein
MSMTEQTERFLTIEEAAAVLHVSRWTVRRRIARGDLQAVRVGDGPRAPIRVAPGDLADCLRRVSG